MLAEPQRLAKEVHLAQAGLSDLPQGWEVAEVGDLLLKDRGVSVGVMYPGDHDPFGIPLIKVGDMSGSLINPRPEFRVSPAVHEEYRRTELEGGELLLTLVGGLGQCAVVPKSMAGWNAARAVAVIRLKNPSDARFLRLCLLSEPLQYLMNAWANTTVQATLNLKEIRQLPVPWPPKRERDAIASAVGALDDKIELNRRMNETLEAMARALFQSWFVDAAKAGLPKGWSVRALYDCASYINGSAFRNEHFSPEKLGLPVIKIGELKDGIAGQTKFTEEILDEKYRITTGEVLFSWSGSPDTSIDTFVWSGRDGWLNQHIFKIQFKRPVEKFFVYYLLRHFKAEFIEIARNKQTTGLGHVTAQDLKRLKTAFPPDDVLVAFNRIVEPLFQKSYSNSCKSRTLAALRDALLPKLLSGELRVPDAKLLKSSEVTVCL